MSKTRQLLSCSLPTELAALNDSCPHFCCLLWVITNLQSNLSCWFILLHLSYVMLVVIWIITTVTVVLSFGSHVYFQFTYIHWSFWFSFVCSIVCSCVLLFLILHLSGWCLVNVNKVSFRHSFCFTFWCVFCVRCSCAVSALIPAV